MSQGLLSTKYIQTFDPKTKTGDPTYAVDSIGYGSDFSSTETKGGGFPAANLISKLKNGFR